MPATQTEYKHILLDEQARPIVEGTTMKVIEIVMAQLAHGWTPAEIRINHRYLSMSQIHAALAYYWDHQADLDTVIEADYQSAKAIQRQPDLLSSLV